MNLYFARLDACLLEFVSEHAIVIIRLVELVLEHANLADHAFGIDLTLCPALASAQRKQHATCNACGDRVRSIQWCDVHATVVGFRQWNSGTMGFTNSD